MAITRPIFIISLAVAGAIGAGLMVLVEPGHGRTVERHVTVVQAAAQETNLGLSAQQIYKREAPGVVVVTDTQGQKVVNPLDPFGAPTTQNASVLGSGFVISKSGDILTNAHVVLGGKNVRVGFSNGQTFPATVVGTDPSTDVAVVKVSVPRALLHPLPLGNSSKVQPGSPVVAIGNPLGQDRTITSGIVSAVSRQIQSLKQGVSIYGAIQTDAAINHGNSGGPLIDADGQVIGITSQILTGSQSESAGSIGIGFAIPINTARQIAQELINNGKATHTYLGIEGVELSSQLTNALNLKLPYGVLITKIVPGSPAAKAGLKAGTTTATINGQPLPLGGDVITAVDGHPIKDFGTLVQTIAHKHSGDTISLTVYRGATPRTVTVTLANETS